MPETPTEILAAIHADLGSLPDRLAAMLADKQNKPSSGGDRETSGRFQSQAGSFEQVLRALGHFLPPLNRLASTMAALRQLSTALGGSRPSAGRTLPRASLPKPHVRAWHAGTRPPKIRVPSMIPSPKPPRAPRKAPAASGGQGKAADPFGIPEASWPEWARPYRDKFEEKQPGGTGAVGGGAGGNPFREQIQATRELIDEVKKLTERIKGIEPDTEDEVEREPNADVGQEGPRKTMWEPEVSQTEQTPGREAPKNVLRPSMPVPSAEQGEKGGFSAAELAEILAAMA